MLTGSEQTNSLNASKTEIVLFKLRNKKITKQLSFHVSGQKIKQVKFDI